MSRRSSAQVIFCSHFGLEELVSDPVRQVFQKLAEDVRQLQSLLVSGRVSLAEEPAGRGSSSARNSARLAWSSPAQEQQAATRKSLQAGPGRKTTAVCPSTSAGRPGSVAEAGAGADWHLRRHSTQVQGSSESLRQAAQARRSRRSELFPDDRKLEKGKRAGSR